jgi:DnaJ-class molecular chaperone
MSKLITCTACKGTGENPVAIKNEQDVTTGHATTLCVPCGGTGKVPGPDHD